MYSKDKRQRITLRLSDEQFASIKSKSEILGISPSDFLRMLINTMMYSDRKIVKPALEDFGRENDEADIDHLV